MVSYRISQCTVPGCGLRFPVGDLSPLGERCPACGEPTAWKGEPFATHEVHEGDQSEADRPALEVLIDNVRSLRNVGSMFRTADGVGAQQVYLGGITPTPAHPGMAKTALGAERSVPWLHAQDGLALARRLREGGRSLWALEGGPRSSSLFEPLPPPPLDQPLVLVVGHEVSGVDPEILGLCDRVLRIPMLGIKGSLNVSVAFGVACYWLRFGRT